MSKPPRTDKDGNELWGTRKIAKLLETDTEVIRALVKDGTLDMYKVQSGLGTNYVMTAESYYRHIGHGKGETDNSVRLETLDKVKKMEVVVKNKMAKREETKESNKKLRNKGGEWLKDFVKRSGLSEYYLTGQARGGALPSIYKIANKWWVSNPKDLMEKKPWLYRDPMTFYEAELCAEHRGLAVWLFHWSAHLYELEDEYFDLPPIRAGSMPNTQRQLLYPVIDADDFREWYFRDENEVRKDMARHKYRYVNKNDAGFDTSVYDLQTTREEVKERHDE